MHGWLRTARANGWRRKFDDIRSEPIFRGGHRSLGRRDEAGHISAPWTDGGPATTLRDLPTTSTTRYCCAHIAFGLGRFRCVQLCPIWAQRRAGPHIHTSRPWQTQQQTYRRGRRG